MWFSEENVSFQYKQILDKENLYVYYNFTFLWIYFKRLVVLKIMFYDK